MIIHADRILSEQGIIDGYLLTYNDKITDIVRKDVAELNADIDYGHHTIIPGIFDTHNHGYLGWNPRDSRAGKQEVLGYVKALASAGVTAVFPTVTDEDGAFKNVVAAIRENSDGARIMGIHSEGPYLNRVGEKGIDKGHPDIDMDFLKKMLADSEGYLRLVGLAPEIEGSKEAIRFLISNNVRVAFAHSNQNYEEAMASFKEGVSVITHTANVMSGLHHRNMGGLGAALLNDEVYNELICDGLHVRNEMIDIILRVKKDAFHKIMMISDNVNIGALPPGRYHGQWGIINVTEDGFALTDTGRLAGSTKPVLYGMGNLVKNLGLPLEKVCQMASLNPAEVYGFADHKGSLRIGKDADFVVIDDDFHCLYTFREGKMIYDHRKDTDLISPKIDQIRIA